MNIVFAVLAGILIGAGVTGWILSRRWQQQVRDAEQSLQAIAARHQQEQEQRRELQQQLAGLKFELNQARNDLRACQQRPS